MEQSKYELHYYKDPEFPAFFHLDHLSKNAPSLHTHWHEHVELLWLRKGTCRVNGGGAIDTAQEGDLIFFSPNCIHSITTLTEECEYFCVTIEKDFCDSFGMPDCQGQFSLVSDSALLKAGYQRLIELMEEQPSFYKEEAKAVILELIVQCYREYEKRNGSLPKDGGTSHRIRKAIRYLQAHFAEEVSVEDVCNHVGYSKYYFCRQFKEITGKTIVDYLNFLRCSNARRLMNSGKYNAGESARLSGFQNLSYFTRTYKKHMGILPSEEGSRKESRQDG